MDGTKRTAFYVTIGANLVLAACGAVTGVLLARALGPAGRGELAAIPLWSSTLITLGGLGIPHTIAYFVARQPQQAAEVYANALVLAMLQCVALGLVGYNVIPLVLGKEYPGIVPLARFYLVSIPVVLFAGINTGMLQGLLRMKEHSLQRVIPTGVYLIGIIVACGRGGTTVEAIVGLLLLSLVLSGILGFWFLRDTVRKGFRVNGGLLKEMLGYGLKTQTADSTQALNMRLDQLVMSMFLPAQGLGYYSVAVTVSGSISPLSQAVGIVTLPDVASKEGNLQARRVAAIVRMTVLILCPLAATLVLLMPWVVALLFGRGFAQAAVPARILVAGSVLMGVNEVLAGGLRGMRRPGVPATAEILSLCVTVVLLYLLLPSYGIAGAAVASVLASLTSSGIMAGYLARRMGLGFRAFVPTNGDWERLLAAGPFGAWRKDASSLLWKR